MKKDITQKIHVNPFDTLPKLLYNCKREITITNELGLHIRPAASIAKLAQKAFFCIWIEKEDQKADAKSISDILTLLCPKGTKITLYIEDESDIRILNEIIKLIINGFWE